MGVPVLPFVVLGLGALVWRARRSRPKAKAKTTQTTFDPQALDETIQTVIFVPTTPGPASAGPSGDPGQPCDAPDGDGAWDALGHCKTFWIDGDTDEAIAALAHEEWQKRGSPTFSELCLSRPDPLAGEFAPPVDNPTLVEITAASLQRYYQVGPLFPPPETTQGDQPTAPYWVHKAWAKALFVVRQELCGL